MKKKRVTILGATGSIGQSTLNVIAQKHENFEVVAMTGGHNLGQLVKDARLFRPSKVALANEDLYEALKQALADLPDIEVCAGLSGLMDVADVETDIVVSAIVGFSGLAPTFQALKKGRVLALANKETLVACGHIFLDKAKALGVPILPLDSEHNAIFQVLEKANKACVDKLILTASGGPFYFNETVDFDKVRPQEALKHPTWKMGAKISIDSATLMNKGLELIEAALLFDAPSHKIDVLVHPQSIVHSLVSYKDGAILAQLGSPDMRIPIAYCLGYPQRLGFESRRLDLTKALHLGFYPPDEKRFPALALARGALEAGGNRPLVFNGANEVAVELFLKEKILFSGIWKLVERVLEKFPQTHISCLDDVFVCNAQVREMAYTLA